MSVKEMERLFAGLRKARAQELHAYKKSWPNPTAKQAKRIAEAQKAYEEAKEKHVHLKNLINF